MSEKIENGNVTKPSGSKLIGFIKSTIKTIIVFIIIGFIAKGLSYLGEIHGKDLPEEYFSGGYPSILALLDSELFMGLIFFVTLAAFVYIAYLLWELHEVAVHKSEASASPQVQLVFALSLCGLLIDKAWWVLAIIISFTSWEHIGDWLSSIIHKDNKSNDNKNAITNKISDEEVK